MRLTGAQALVRVLASECVDVAYGVVGGKLAPLLHALHATSNIRYVGTRHEANAAIMAAGHFAGSGRIAMAMGEMGPGGLNLAAGAGVAYNNNLAVLLVTTNQHRAAAYPHAGMFMDLDTLSVMRPITKWNALVSDPRRIPDLARRAFREALSGRPGPVHLDIPQDVLAAECDLADDEFDAGPENYRGTLPPRPNAAGIAAAAQLLAAAKRPLIVAGGGVVVSGAEEGVRLLAGRLGAPVVPTQMALGVVASDSPHFIGHGGIIGGAAIPRAFAEADAIVLVGCRLSSWMWDEAGALARRHHRLVNINIDPAALGAPALHDIALQADASAALTDLLVALAPLKTSADPQWLAGLRDVRADYERGLQRLAEGPSQVMHPAALAQAIAAALPRNAIAVYDGGHTTFWSNDFTPVHATRTRFHDPGMCQLGYGLAYGIALQALHPGRPVVNITGDGSFGFTLQELDTARRHKLPVVSIIHNNAAWGIIRASQKSQFDFELGSGLEDTDYGAIARGFGCFGETVRRAEEVAPAFGRALASGLPAVLDCHTKFVPHPSLPAFGRMNRYGFDALSRKGPLLPGSGARDGPAAALPPGKRGGEQRADLRSSSSAKRSPKQ